MRDCRYHEKGRCKNEQHCQPFCSYENKDERYRCWDYAGANE